MDHASGTACSENVYEIMKPFFVENSYNPGGMYEEAVQIRELIEQSRTKVARILKARPDEIIFVDGATEANNLAIIGSVRAWQKENRGKRAHIITTVIEHAAVLETCRALEVEGLEVTYLNVDGKGLISLKELKESIQENTVLVSIGYVNGEIGTIQDIKGVTKTIRHFRKHNQTVYPYVHTDAVQAANYVDEVGVPQLGIDLMVVNSSKIYGPKKMAILFVKSNITIDSIIYGGNQEKGMRSGTENVPYVVGFTTALLEARSMREEESRRLGTLQIYAERKIKGLLPNVRINSIAGNKIPNILNVTFPDISHEEIVIRLDARGVMASVKSACKAGEEGDSHVIRAIADKNSETGSIRFSFGRSTDKSDIDKTLKELQNIVSGMNYVYKKYYLG